MVNEVEIRKWWAIFRPHNELTELRILGRNKTYSGYYTDVNTFVNDLVRYDGYGGIYAPINAIKNSCYGRVQHDQIIEKPKETTSDNDIDCRTTILIDIDPIRPSGVNSSEAEKVRAHDKAAEVFRFLRKQGFNDPVIADSANGYHLYYKVLLTNDATSTNLVKDFLGALDMMFSDSEEGGAHIDTAVFNAGRIAKVIGTSTDKGADTPDRPRRASCFKYIPQEFKENDIAFVKKVAELLPKPEVPDKYNRYSPERINLRDFITKHGIEVVKESRFGAGVKFVLKECPFDHNHKAPDAALFQLDNGALGFRCLHASCASYHWRDYRLLYEPDAYDKSAREDFQWRRKYNAPVKPAPVKPTDEDERGKVWMQAGEFKPFDLRNAQAIPLGIPTLDKKMLGLIKGETTIISGGSGAGKTTFVNHIILNAVQRNYRVALWSGEMAGGRIVSWLDQMAAGKSYCEQIEGTDGLYRIPKRYEHIRKRINDWLGDRLYIYNNNYGQKWSSLSADVRKCIDENHIDLAIFDNLMAVDLDSFPGENNDKQKGYINELTEIAAQTNIHIALVCHPRKENVNQLIRKESIAGTSDLANMAFNVLLLHRTGKDFENRAKNFFNPIDLEKILSCDYSLVLEVNKARTTGLQDLLVGLWYEKETRRLISYEGENVIYGWDDPVADYDDLPPDDFDLHPNTF